MYQYKAAHGTDEYREIGLSDTDNYSDEDDGTPRAEYLENFLDDDIQYYKYSSDPLMYTELGVPGLEENYDDYIIVFWTGERDSLNNAKVGAPLNVARDIGFTIVDKDLQIKTGDWYEGTIERDETGEYYGTDDAGGGEGTRTAMSNTGNVWITNYQEDLITNSDFTYVINDMDDDDQYTDSMKPWKNASKLKNIKLSSGNIFLLYEIWNEDSY